jgi:hypothetical protein
LYQTPLQTRQYDIIVILKIIYYNFVALFFVITLLFPAGSAGDLSFVRLEMGVSLGGRRRPAVVYGFFALPAV